MGRPTKDITGMTFGRLVAKCRANDYISPSGRHIAQWKCECSCGNNVIVTVSHLTSGSTKSCGCYNQECRHNRTSNGLRYTSLYGVWNEMKQRCFNENSTAYINYGGRGIKVCDEWANDFESFYSWSIDNGYMHGLSIDRINNDGDYEPSNCRWVIDSIQANNKRTNKKYSLDGDEHTVSEWCEIFGIRNKSTVYARLSRGWNIKRALTEKIK